MCYIYACGYLHFNTYIFIILIIYVNYYLNISKKVKSDLLNIFI